jgi:dTDP-4-dehydrorhamnose 3,5-epimerase-like enzyme
MSSSFSATACILTIKPYLGNYQASELPFAVKRIYWCYNTPASHVRGHHAHRYNEQLLVALTGTVHIVLENTTGTSQAFTLSDPSQGLYIPPLHWRKITSSPDAILLCMASRTYKETDYIRNYEEFKNIKA